MKFFSGNHRRSWARISSLGLFNLNPRSDTQLISRQNKLSFKTLEIDKFIFTLHLDIQLVDVGLKVRWNMQSPKALYFLSFYIVQSRKRRTISIWGIKPAQRRGFENNFRGTKHIWLHSFNKILKLLICNS